jgi:hypothetical protein
MDTLTSRIDMDALKADVDALTIRTDIDAPLKAAVKEALIPLRKKKRADGSHRDAPLKAAVKEALIPLREKNHALDVCSCAEYDYTQYSGGRGLHGSNLITDILISRD